MRKNLNKGMAMFMAIAVIALNFGLIGNVLADELGDDQSFAMPLDSRTAPDRGPQPASAPEQGGSGVGAIAIDCNGLMQNITNYLGVVANMNLDVPEFDLNNDTVVSEEDLTIATNAVPSADVNNDGYVNTADVVMANSICPNTPPVVPDMPPVPTRAYCDAMRGDLKMVQNVDHSAGAYAYDDINGDGSINLTDTILLTQLDLGGPNGTSTPDGVINLTDVVLLTQRCADFPPVIPPTDTVNDPNPPVVPISSNNSGGGHGGNAPMFTPLVTNPIVTPQVLGEKIVECKNKANTTLTKFADGTLVRGCGPQVYIMKNGQKMYIPNLETLRSKYFGKKILNIGDLINSIKDWSTKIAVK